MARLFGSPLGNIAVAGNVPKAVVIDGAIRTDWIDGVQTHFATEFRKLCFGGIAARHGERSRSQPASRAAHNARDGDGSIHFLPTRSIAVHRGTVTLEKHRVPLGTRTVRVCSDLGEPLGTPDQGGNLVDGLL